MALKDFLQPLSKYPLGRPKIEKQSGCHWFGNSFSFRALVLAELVQCLSYVNRGHHGTTFSDCAPITEAAQLMARSYSNVFQCNVREAYNCNVGILFVLFLYALP
jgi:hypothetical protein